MNYAVNHEVVEKCLLSLSSSKNINVSKNKNETFAVVGTAQNINSAITIVAQRENLDYCGSVYQFAVLFSPHGGRLYVRGWRRKIIKVNRGVRIYRFFKIK